MATPAPNPVTPAAASAPEPAAPAPVAPEVAAPTVTAPETVAPEIVTPSDLVPESIPTAENSPADYGTVFIDPTDYSVGATENPSVIFAERGSGCQFAIQQGQSVPSGACAQAAPQSPTVAAASPRFAPTSASRPSAPSISLGPISVGPSGVQVSGLTTAASRRYYNQLARPLVNLQANKPFLFPLSIPAPITSLFGWRLHPIFGEHRFHAGTDFGAPMGTPVLATRAGQVTAAEFLGGYGLTVILRHNEDDLDLESRYAHLSQLLVQPGEWVEKGEVVGLVGSTGNSTGPHLHFELRQLTGDGWVAVSPNEVMQQALNNLIATLNNPQLALGLLPSDEAENQDAAAKPAETAAPVTAFRPAQPNAN
ncbi:MAG: M23 family metallopeptidase [Leptolyngbya sp. SIO4C1]|nr:M23 family metallopeptidase [Leptolyngbya sp. SIO4C1]